MNVLSKKVRNIYLGVLILIFIVGTPFLVLYSIGYRFDDINLFVKTGGITVVLREPHAGIFIDDEYVRDTNFLQKTYFFQSISSGVHKVSILKEGFQVWETNLRVYPEFVSEAYPLVLENKVPVVEIEPLLLAEDERDNQVAVHEPNPEYSRLASIFETLAYRSLNGDIINNKNMLVKDNGKNFVFIWDGSDNNTPYYFCGVFECSKSVSVQKPLFEHIKSFDFYPFRDDVLLLLMESGLYAMQIDNEQNIQVFTLYTGKDIDFYIQDESRIYVKDRDRIVYLDL